MDAVEITHCHDASARDGIGGRCVADHAESSRHDWIRWWFWRVRDRGAPTTSKSSEGKIGFLLEFDEFRAMGRLTGNLTHPANSWPKPRTAILANPGWNGLPDGKYH